MQEAVYDLGDIDTVLDNAGARRQRPPASHSPATDRRPRPRAEQRHMLAGNLPARADRGPAHFDWGATLSLLVPGLGQLSRGRIQPGLLFLTSGTFVGTFAWAVWECRHRLADTLPFLGLSRAWSLRLLLISFALMALVHVLAVTGSMKATGGRRPAAGLLAAASFLVPGWGQALAGRRWRTAACLLGLWLVGFAWLLASAPMHQLLLQHQLVLPAWLTLALSPLALYTGPAVLWAVSMSDAFHGRDRSH